METRIFFHVQCVHTRRVFYPNFLKEVKNSGGLFDISKVYTEEYIYITVIQTHAIRA